MEAVDVMAIVVGVLLLISCCPIFCAFIRPKQDLIWAMCCSCVSAILLVLMGTNLLMRHILGLCDFDPDETCSSSSGNAGRPGVGGSPKKGKECSSECNWFEDSGITLIVIGIL